MKHSRPLVGGSIDFDEIKLFRIAAKKRGLLVEGNFCARGNLVYAFDVHHRKVGHMVNYNGGIGFLSPSHEAFKIDYIDEVVRDQEGAVSIDIKILLGESIEERKKEFA